MPHTTIEYSGNLGDQFDAVDLLARFHGVLSFTVKSDPDKVTVREIIESIADD